MKNKVIIIFLIGLILISGCVSSEDKGLIKQAYSEEWYPDNFYNENIDFTSNNVAFYLETKVESRNYRAPEFYCTNNFNEAKTKVDELIKGPFRPKTIVDINENEKFFEFKTIETRNGKVTFTIRYRAHKCSYLNDLKIRHRIPVGPFAESYTQSLPESVGTFAQKPITRNNVKELIEYLWFISTAQEDKEYVTSNLKISEGGNLVKVIIPIIWVCEICRKEDNCDILKYYELTYGVDKKTGDISLYNQNLIKDNIKGKCY